MRITKAAAFAILVLTLCASPAIAQSDRGTLTGTVSDPSGAVVANARVTVTSQDSGETREATTTDEGNYTFPELKAETYRLTVEAPGFRTSVIEDIKIAVQVTRSADVTLEAGVTTETVTVTADTTALQTENATRIANVNERQVKELPLQVTSEAGGRTALAFIFLDSNVAAAGGESGVNATRFRVSGGQALGTEILIDGASVRRTQNGTFFSEVAPGPNAFQEFTISTSTFSAEFGNSSGGVVNFTQKSGTNEFHGEVYDFVRNEKLNANSAFNNALGRTSSGALVAPRGRDNQNDFGFNVGGPIILPRFGEGGPTTINGKNRSFFFFNYEGYRFTRGQNFVVTVSTLR